MKTQKEYNVSKLEVGDSCFYFFGNDYMLAGSTFISFKKRRMAQIPMIEEDFEIFKERLNYIADNNLTINL